MFDCLKSFYIDLIGGYLGNLRSGFVTKMMYIDESLYMVGREGGWINPPKLYSLLKSKTSTEVSRRPVYGVMYFDRALGRVLRLLSYKHNILSLDLTLLQSRKDAEAKCLGRYVDIIQLSRSFLDKIECESVGEYRVGWLRDTSILLVRDDPILVVTGEEPIDALAGYMYVSRILLALLGEWVLFNPIKYMGVSEEPSIRVLPVDDDMDVTDDFFRLMGFVIECGGFKYLEII